MCQMKPIDFPEWLQEKIFKRGWRPTDLAKHARISDAAISRILRGERKADPETLVAVSNALKISPITMFRAAGLLPEVETNSDKVSTMKPGDSNSIIVPLNIYFKLNALDTNQNGLNYKYVDFNNSKETVKHIKKVKFALENEAENRPFTFTIKFNINRNKVIFKRPDSFTTPYITKAIRDNFRPAQFALREASVATFTRNNNFE